MIPYKDDNPTHRVPVATYAIIALNCLSWFVLQGMGTEPQLSDSICRFGIIPGQLLDGNASAVSQSYCQLSGQSWIVVLTSMFVHGGWLHLIGNLWFLWLFADNIEDVLGPAKFIGFYLIGGVAAVAAQLISDRYSLIPMVGASGAIGGVMGAYAWLYPTVRVRIAIILGFFIIRRTLPAWLMLAIWLVIQLLAGILALQSSTQGGVAFWAHVGGFLAGFILIRFFYHMTPPPLSDLH